MNLTREFRDTMLDRTIGEQTVSVALLFEGVELEGNGYERQVAPFGPATQGVIANTEEVRFPRATPGGYIVNAIALYGDGGELIGSSRLEESKSIGENDWFFIMPGDLLVGLLD